MRAEIPRPIELTEEEKELESQLGFDLKPGRENEAIIASCERMFELMLSLANRGAIPQARYDFFAEADHNIGVNRSRLDVFRSNGVRTEDVFRDPHFHAFHLRYFLYGPQLPRETIEGFCRFVNEDRGTSAMVLDELMAFARAQVRRHGLDRNEAAEQFYLLALECGQEFNARAIRDAKSTKPR